MAPRRKSPVSAIQDVLHRVLKNTTGAAPRRGGQRLLKVFSAFESLGPPFTEHAEPVHFRNGCLTLVVDDSAWLTQLTFLRDDLIKRINAAVKDDAVKEVRLRHGTLKTRRPPEPKPVPPVLTEEEAKRIESWASEIKDPELKEVVKRAARWGIKNPRSQP